MAVVVCPSCRKKLRPPDHLAGRRVTCPKCDEVIMLPADLSEPDEDIPVPEPEPEVEDEPLPLSARLGIIALVLGVSSILFLCLPFIGGYASLALSGAGLLVALTGLLRVRLDGDEPMSQSLAGGAGIWGDFGARARDYPLAGVGACLLSITLALLPALFH